MKNKNSIIIAICILVMLIMGVSYSLFSSSFVVGGTGNINTNFDIKIIGVTTLEKTGKAENITEPTHDGTKAAFNLKLVRNTDSAIYQITVKNNGNIDAVLDSIEIINTKNDIIDVSVSGISEGASLKTGSTISYLVKAKVKDGVKLTEDFTTQVTVNTNFIQDNNQVFN